MKIGITGHTHGIGKATHDLLESRGHTLKGFSRQNGFNIDNVFKRKEILKQVEDFDVFINNAFSYGQTLLLEELIELWEGKDKLIVNIGSKVTMMNFVIPGHEEYVAEKKKQEKVIRERLSYPFPQLSNILIGLTDTRMVANWEAEKIDPNYIASTIEFIINNKDFIEIQSMVIDVPKQRLTEIKIK